MSFFFLILVHQQNIEIQLFDIQIFHENQILKVATAKYSFSTAKNSPSFLLNRRSS